MNDSIVTVRAGPHRFPHAVLQPLPGRPLRQRLLGVVRRALPQACMLCAAPCSTALVCVSCTPDLPRNDRACDVCALPLPVAGRCGHCAAAPPPYAKTMAAFVYAFPIDRLVQSYKYQASLALAGWFADAMLAARGSSIAADLLIAMPLTRGRQRERGFNQSLELAKALGKATGIPVAIDAVARVRDAVPQATLPWAERRRNVEGAFACTGDVRGRRIVVIDDVMTTGASLEELARTLGAAGAESVENRVIARTPAPDEASPHMDRRARESSVRVPPIG